MRRDMRTLGRDMAARHGLLTLLAVSIATAFLFAGLNGQSAVPQPPPGYRQGQSSEEAIHRSAGCVTCHSPMDEPTMHPTKTVQLGCTDCHGGNSSASVSPGTAQNSPDYLD